MAKSKKVKNSPGISDFTTNLNIPDVLPSNTALFGHPRKSYLTSHFSVGIHISHGHCTSSFNTRKVGRATPKAPVSMCVKCEWDCNYKFNNYNITDNSNCKTMYANNHTTVLYKVCLQRLTRQFPAGKSQEWAVCFAPWWKSKDGFIKVSSPSSGKGLKEHTHQVLWYLFQKCGNRSELKKDAVSQILFLIYNGVNGAVESYSCRLEADN